MEGENKVYTVEYQVGTYNGSVEVIADVNDDNDVIIAKAKRLLTCRTATLPFGYESFRVVANG